MAKIFLDDAPIFPSHFGADSRLAETGGMLSIAPYFGFVGAAFSYVCC